MVGKEGDEQFFNDLKLAEQEQVLPPEVEEKKRKGSPAFRLYYGNYRHRSYKGGTFGAHLRQAGRTGNSVPPKNGRGHAKDSMDAD
jgi:hypothetical protein